MTYVKARRIEATWDETERLVRKQKRGKLLILITTEMKPSELLDRLARLRDFQPCLERIRINSMPRPFQFSVSFRFHPHG